MDVITEMLATEPDDAQQNDESCTECNKNIQKVLGKIAIYYLKINILTVSITKWRVLFRI